LRVRKDGTGQASCLLEYLTVDERSFLQYVLDVFDLLVHGDFNMSSTTLGNYFHQRSQSFTVYYQFTFTTLKNAIQGFFKPDFVMK